jgi:CheY-like chemotaxis protein
VKEANHITQITSPDKSTKKITMKLNILIAEDDEFSEMLFIKLVEGFTRKIIKAKTGAEVIRACRKNPDIDLVLMDINMLEMDGYEATRQIREFNKDVVIIAQTAHALVGDREKSIAAGCNDYISKPINKVDLRKMVNKHLKSSIFAALPFPLN